MNLQRRLAAEGIGTALLLAAVVGSGIMGERLAGGNVAIALLANTIATGATLVALILTFGADIRGALQSGRDHRRCVTGWDPVARCAALHRTAADRRRRGCTRSTSHVWRTAAPALSQTSSWECAAFQRVRGDVRTARGYLGLLEKALGVCSSCRRSLHHGSVLVYRVDVVCEPGRHRRPRTDGYVRWHSSG